MDIDALSADEMKAFVASHFWWHSIDLGNGVVTPGFKTLDVMRREADTIFGPLDVQGASVLDIGAWNGGFSVEALRRGAAHVTGLDHYTWSDPGFKGRETFDFVARSVGAHLRAVDVDLDVPRLDLSSLGSFDVVLYLGVFYHLKDPIAATREICALAKKALVLETHVEKIKDKRPAMIFYPGAELNGDRTNWWGPNTSCVTALLKDCGFMHISVTPGTTPQRQIFHAFR